jgi:DNA-binding CsgD family transcriptional regulator
VIGPLTVEEAREQIDVRLAEINEARAGIDATLIEIDELWTHVRTGQPEVRRPLTPNELAVARIAAWSNLTLPEIARRRWVSPNTVRTQMKSVYRKLGITRRADLRQALLDAERIPAGVAG